MDEDRRTEALGGGEERREPCVAEDGAVDVRADLDAGQSELAHQVLELGDGAVDVLQRHGAEAEETVGLALDHGGDLLVEIAAEDRAVGGVEPVGE